MNLNSKLIHAVLICAFIIGAGFAGHYTAVIQVRMSELAAPTLPKTLVTFFSRQPTYSEAEDVIVVIRVTNQDSLSIHISRMSRLLDVWFEVYSSQEYLMRTDQNDIAIGGGLVDVVTIPAKESADFQFNLSHWYDLKKPDRYHVRVRCNLEHTDQKGRTIAVNPVKGDFYIETIRGNSLPVRSSVRFAHFAPR